MKIQIEDSVISCKRGVYGIFIIKNGAKVVLMWEKVNN